MARSQIGPSAILLARAQPTGWGWLLNGTAVNVYVPWRRFAARLPWVESGTHDHAVNLFCDRAVTWPKLIAGQILFEDPDNLRNGARVLVDLVIGIEDQGRTRALEPCAFQRHYTIAR